MNFFHLISFSLLYVEPSRFPDAERARDSLCACTCVKVLLWRFMRFLDGRDMLAPDEEP